MTIGLPMRELSNERIRLLELATGCFVAVEGRVVCGLIILSVRIFIFWLEFVVRGPVMLEFGRAGLLELIIFEFELRLFVLVDGGKVFELPDVTLVELLPGVSLLG